MGEILYKVQVGSYANIANAKKQLKNVKNAGFNGVIAPYGKLYRVQCGAFKSKSNAKRTLAKVKKIFPNATVIEEISATPDSGYKVMLTTKAKEQDAISNEILVIEPEDYTIDEIKKLKKHGATLLGYLSVGSVSDERPYYNTLKPFRLSRLEDWHHEWYLDLREEKVRKWCASRAKEIKAMGFDGWWLDNLDVYEYHSSPEMYEAITNVLKSIKDVDGYIMVNGGSEYISKLMDSDANHKSITFIDGVTQEEVISLIKSYSGKGEFGKQEPEMNKWYESYMKRLLRHDMYAFLLEYTRDKSVKKKIIDFCTKNKMTGYYISGDVDL